MKSSIYMKIKEYSICDAYSKILSKIKLDFSRAPKTD